MLKSYFRIAYRNLIKYKLYSIINIIGFSIALVPVILTILYVKNEFSYDRYNKNFNRIYRVAQQYKYYDRTIKTAIMPNPLAAAMKAELPEIKYAARMRVWPADVSYKKHWHSEKYILYADPDIFKIFTIPLIAGKYFTPSDDKYSVLVSQSMAKKYFGSANPIGKTIKLRDVYYMDVIGIYKDLPVNSHFHADFIAPASILDGSTVINATSDLNSWGFSMFFSYFQLKKGADIDKLEATFPKFYNKYRHNFPSEKRKLYFQPLSYIHLHSHTQTELENNSDIKTIYLYLSVALIILLIACINYVNLATARYSRRTKEMGMRKIMGAHSPQLIKQLLTESMFITFFAFIITVVLVEFALPYFNSYVDRNIHFNILTNFQTFLWMIGFIALIGIIAGLYPAVFMSTSKPLSYLGSDNTLRSPRLRTILTVTQFALSIGLIFCTIVVREQLEYVSQKDLGYNKDNIIFLHVNGMSNSKVEVLKNEILKNPDVISVSASNALPNTTFNGGGVNFPGKPKNLHFFMAYGVVDYDFLDLYGLKIEEGRKFSKKYASDQTNAVIINETAVRELGWKNPIGKQIYYTSPNGRSLRTVIGVVKDFNTGSLYKNIIPYFFVIDSAAMNFHLSVKIKPDNIHKTLLYILNKKKSLSPGSTVNYQFFSDFLKESYGAVFKLQTLFSLFSIFTILVACLGLFGMISFMTEVRKKEIGIRKVLGASWYGIAKLFMGGLLKPIVFASILAIPAAYLAMKDWLNNFAYRTNIHPGMFLFAVLSIYLVTLMILTVQVFRASSVNPAETLRNE